MDLRQVFTLAKQAVAESNAKDLSALDRFESDLNSLPAGPEKLAWLGDVMHVYMYLLLPERALVTFKSIVKLSADDDWNTAADAWQLGDLALVCGSLSVAEECFSQFLIMQESDQTGATAHGFDVKWNAMIREKLALVRTRPMEEVKAISADRMQELLHNRDAWLSFHWKFQ